MKLDKHTRTVLGERAKQRRLQLEMSCAELARMVDALPGSVAQWEAALPLKTAHDAQWEVALGVPPGWLRDITMSTPVLNGASLPISGWSTFADFIRAFCIWYSGPPTRERTMSYADLPPREQRIVTIMTRRYGIEGEERATLQQIGEDLGLTRERVRQIADRAIERFDVVGAPVDLVARLHLALSEHLPCLVAALPMAAQDVLGERMSLEGADRFFRERLGVPLVNITSQAGATVALQEKMVVADDPADGELVRAVRQAAIAMIRQAGAAQIFYVTGTVGAEGFNTGPSEVAQCARMFRGFEWLIEEEGWFWFGPSNDNRAKSTALKVLAAANRPLDIEELYGAMARARFTRQTERISAASVSAPMPVLQIVLGKFPEIRRSHFNDYRLDLPSELALNALTTYLSPSEQIIRRTIVEHGGIASRRTLAQALIDAGHLEKVTMDMALMSSPVFRRHDRGLWMITGFSFSHDALQRAEESARGLQQADE
jgi:hypothetical protein